MAEAFPLRYDIRAALAQVDTAADEDGLRSAVDTALRALAADRRDPAPALSAAWSATLLHGVAAGLRLATGATDWAWFASGSVARGEAVPASDVETMVVLEDAATADDKADALRRAAHVHALLERCGIQGDANGVLGSRPRFCRRAASWTSGIDRWGARPRQDRGVVMTGLMADSRGLPGKESVSADWLRTQVGAAIGRNHAVRHAMLHDATVVRASVPSRLRVFATSADSADVKAAAIDPVVKIARWAAVSAGSTSLITPQRLDDAAAAGVLDADDTSSLRECFDWLMRFRWRTRATAFLSGTPVTDVVTLSDLAPQERAALRDVAREVAGIRRKLDYLASTPTFR